MIFSLFHVARLPVITPLLLQLVVRLHYFRHFFVGLRRRFPTHPCRSVLSGFAPAGSLWEQIQSETHGIVRERRSSKQRKNPNIKVTSSLMDPSIEQLRMGMGGVCARQDNTQEWRHVIEISIKEVISGVIAEVLWFVFVCVCE